MATQALLDRDIRAQGLPPAAMGLGGKTDVVSPSHTYIVVPSHAQIHAEAARVLDDVRSTMARNPERARVAALRLVALLTQTADAEPACTRGGLAPWQQRKVERFMRDNLESSIHLRDLAQEVSLSVSHFSRAFKASFGDTPHLYMSRLRIQRAQELMLATREPLSQIALVCGFADQSHLSKLFRRELNESPTAWRRRSVIDRDANASSRHAERHDGICKPACGPSVAPQGFALVRGQCVERSR